MEISGVKLATILGYTAIVFLLGQYFQVSETAIPLDQPFIMKVTIDGHKHEFKKIILLEDPNPISKGKIRLQIRAVSIDPFVINNMGSIIAQKAKVNKGVVLDALEVVKKAWAQNFKWEGHANNTHYKEVYINKTTIRRYYSDGWILQYNVDSNGNSIRSSFQWIKKR